MQRQHYPGTVEHCLCIFNGAASMTGPTWSMARILAGGVAIGSAANWSFSPATAVAVGVFAGILSTAGFRCEQALPQIVSTI